MNDVEAIVMDAAKKIASTQESDVAKKFTAFEDLLNEVSTTLSDIAESVGKGDDDSAITKALTEGLKALKFNVSSPVTVNVEPTPVHVHVAPAELQERIAAKGWKIKFEYDGITTNIPSGATLTRLT